MEKVVEPSYLGVSLFEDDFVSSASWVGLSITAGACSTLSAVVITYPANRAVRLEYEQGAVERASIMLANLLLTGVSTALGILATGLGPVAVVFPLQVGATLLSNMVIQSRLGLAKYTKNMTVGTLVLATAVMLLPDIGPRSPPSSVDVFMLLEEKLAQGFIFVSLMLMVAGLCILVQVKTQPAIDRLPGPFDDAAEDANSTQNSSRNTLMLFMYALVGGTGTVLNTSIAKVVQMHLHNGIRAILSFTYVFLACLCLAVAAMANGTLDDPTLFVPISNGVNLVLNCLAGLCIWGDWARLEYPGAYCMVYVLVVLGTYLVSSLDFLFSNYTQQAEEKVNAVRNVYRKGRSFALGATPIGTPTNRKHVRDYSLSEVFLQEILRDESPCSTGKSLREVMLNSSEEPESPEVQRRIFKNCLRRALDSGMVDHEGVADLCLVLVEERGEPNQYWSEGFKKWVQQYVAPATPLPLSASTRTRVFTSAF